MKARYINPLGDATNVANYKRVIGLAEEEGVNVDATYGSDRQKRQVLRHAMVVGGVIEYLNFEVRDDPDKHLRSIFKMEMTPPCLMHSELRIGENILTKFCQRIMSRVKLFIYLLYYYFLNFFINTGANRSEGETTDQTI